MYTKQKRKRRGKKAQLSIHVNKLTTKGTYIYIAGEADGVCYLDEIRKNRNPIHSSGFR